MLIRREGPADAGPIHAVHTAAFGPIREVLVEADLVDALRATADWIPALSFVAEHAGQVVGHVVSTRAWVGDVEVVGLGPLGVAPEHQRRGVGSALVHASLGAAEALGLPLVGLLGSPAYYHRFGFVAASGVGIAAPEPAWGDDFQARVFRPDPPRGAFRYAAPFDDL